MFLFLLYFYVRFLFKLMRCLKVNEIFLSVLEIGTKSPCSLVCWPQVQTILMHGLERRSQDPWTNVGFPRYPIREFPIHMKYIAWKDSISFYLCFWGSQHLWFTKVANVPVQINYACRANLACWIYCGVSSEPCVTCCVNTVSLSVCMHLSGVVEVFNHSCVMGHQDP